MDSSWVMLTDETKADLTAAMKGLSMALQWAVESDLSWVEWMGES